MAPDVAVVQEFPIPRFAWSVKPPGGLPARWAADEPLVENVSSGSRLRDNMPGGDATAECVLSRDPRVSWPDTGVYGDVEVYGAGLDPIWSGRIDKAPQVDGDHMSISPAAVGHGVELDDVDLAGVGFINRRQGDWTGPSAERRKSLIGSNSPHQSDAASAWDGDTPALRMEIQGAWASGTLPRCETWFDAGSGIRISRLMANWRNGDADTSFVLERQAATAPAGTYEGSGDVYGSTTGSIDYSPTTPRRYVLFSWWPSGSPGGADGKSYAVDITNLTVLADTGLTLQGEFPNIGYTASQMLGYLVPLHTSLTADPEDLEDSGYLIQQAWYPNGGTLSPIVKDVTKYEQLLWFVFGKRFQLRFPGAFGRTYHAYAGPSQLQESGEDGSRLWREIIVSYQDVDGTTRTVGPPGSGTDVEDAGLEITDPDHPAVRAEKPRRDRLVLKGISTPSRAIEAGEFWLREANELSKSGSAVFSGFLLDSKSIFRPVSQLRGGDRVVFGDTPDRSPRLVVNRDYDEATDSVTVELDAPSEKYEALLERMQADIESLQLA